MPTDLDIASLPIPEPVLDTSDLAAIAALPLLDEIPGEASARKALLHDTDRTLGLSI